MMSTHGWCFVALALTSAAACGDDPACGPDEAADLVLGSTSGSDELVQWGEFQSSPNNDCGEPGGPVSLTVEGKQVGVALQSIVLCMPRPDKLAGKTIDIGNSSRVRLIDVFSFQSGGQGSLDRTRAASGTIGFTGICDDGLDPAGYSLDFDLTVPLDILQGDVITSDSLHFLGKVQVAVSQP